MNPQANEMSDRDWENLLISSFEEVDPETLRFFEDHSVRTVGSLLGATQGLTVPVRIEGPDQEVLEAFVKHLLEILPSSLLDTYRATQPEMPPSGVLPDILDEGNDGSIEPRLPY